MYFPQLGIRGDVLKIMLWLIVGLLLVGLSALAEQRRAARRPAPAVASAAVPVTARLSRAREREDAEIERIVVT